MADVASGKQAVMVSYADWCRLVETKQAEQLRALYPRRKVSREETRLRDQLVGLADRALAMQPPLGTKVKIYAAIGRAIWPEDALTDKEVADRLASHRRDMLRMIEAGDYERQIDYERCRGCGVTTAGGHIFDPLDPGVASLADYTGRAQATADMVRAAL